MPDDADDDSVGDIWDYAQTNDEVIPLSSSGKFDRPTSLSSIPSAVLADAARPETYPWRLDAVKQLQNQLQPHSVRL